MSRPNATVLRLPPRRDSKAQPCGASPLGTLPRLRSGISRLRRFGSLRPITPSGIGRYPSESAVSRKREPLGTLPRLRSGISHLRRFGSLRPITPSGIGRYPSESAVSRRREPLGTLPRLRSGAEPPTAVRLRPSDFHQAKGAARVGSPFRLVESGGVEPPCCERTEKPSTYLALT